MDRAHNQSHFVPVRHDWPQKREKMKKKMLITLKLNYTISKLISYEFKTSEH